MPIEPAIDSVRREVNDTNKSDCYRKPGQTIAMMPGWSTRRPLINRPPRPSLSVQEASTVGPAPRRACNNCAPVKDY